MEATRPGPLKTRIVPFSDNLPFPENEIKAYASMYKLLSDLLSGRADTYAKQELLKQRRHVILNLFWVFGRYSIFRDEDEGRLVIEGKSWEFVPDFKNIVHKLDNALHRTVL